MSEDEKEIVPVTVYHKYSHYVLIPAKLLKRLGIILSSEVVIDPDTKNLNPKNPFAWELKIKPVQSLECQFCGNPAFTLMDTEEGKVPVCRECSESPEVTQKQI